MTGSHSPMLNIKIPYAHDHYELLRLWRTTEQGDESVFSGSNLKTSPFSILSVGPDRKIEVQKQPLQSNTETFHNNQINYLVTA